MPGSAPTIDRAKPKVDPKLDLKTGPKANSKPDPTGKPATGKPATAPASKRPAPDPASEEQAAKSQAPTSVQPVEPEDAYLTGVSRSLQRRLLGLNVEGKGGQSKPIPGATAAGLHATGSFTKAQDAKPTARPSQEPKGKKK
jgi:hypothetical protein